MVLLELPHFQSYLGYYTFCLRKYKGTYDELLHLPLVSSNKVLWLFTTVHVFSLHYLCYHISKNIGHLVTLKNSWKEAMQFEEPHVQFVLYTFFKSLEWTMKIYNHAFRMSAGLFPAYRY